MGLNISHGAWHGAYSAFHRWREKIAQVAGFPDLNTMEGFTEGKGIAWNEKHPLTPLLSHSDCDGHINRSELPAIIDALKPLLPALDLHDGGGHVGNYGDKTREFIKGCELAISKKERLEFR